MGSEVSAADRRFMARAIELARRGRTHPNPRVGAVIVRGGRVIAEGHHRRCGAPHAEAVALARAGHAARGATLYVTLEPCDHHGRTPPCAAQIVAAGIRRVLVAARDPDPRVRGRGLRRLRRGGAQVVTGLLAPAAEELNQAYYHYHRHGRPLVELKLATTLDGRVALADGRSQWITGREARRQAHRLRAAADCVLVGAGTVRLDDPALTVRLARGAQPLRAVVSSALEIPLNRQLFAPGSAPTVVFTTAAAERGRRAAALRRRGIEMVKVRRRGPGIDLERVLGELAERFGVRQVLVEGGPTVAASLLRQRLVDRLHIMMAAAIMGGEHQGWSEGLGVRQLESMPRLRAVEVRRLGEDIWIQGEVVRQDG